MLSQANAAPISLRRVRGVSFGGPTYLRYLNVFMRLERVIHVKDCLRRASRIYHLVVRYPNSRGQMLVHTGLAASTSEYPEHFSTLRVLRRVH